MTPKPVQPLAPQHCSSRRRSTRSESERRGAASPEEWAGMASAGVGALLLAVLLVVTRTAAQVITVHAEDNTAPTFDRSPGANLSNGGKGLSHFGNDVYRDPRTKDLNVAFAWSAEYYSYDITVKSSGYYNVDFYYGNLKSIAQILGPSCVWKDCRGLPTYKPWRVAVYAREGPCSAYANPKLWDAKGNPLPSAWEPLNCQAPEFTAGRRGYTTVLPPYFFGNTRSFTVFKKLSGEKPVRLQKGRYCLQLCNGWDVNQWDRLVLKKLPSLPEPRDRCGDGYCHPGESCESCPADCGQCWVNQPPLSIGNVRENFILAWWFDKPAPTGPPPAKDLWYSKLTRGYIPWRPDVPEVDISSDEISFAVDDNAPGEYQSYTIWVAQPGRYRAGVHYATKLALKGAPRLALRMGEGACAARGEAWSCAADAPPRGWREVFAPSMRWTPENNVGTVNKPGTDVSGYRTVKSKPFELPRGRHCLQVCVLAGGYRTSRFTLEALDFDARAVAPNPWYAPVTDAAAALPDPRCDRGIRYLFDSGAVACCPPECTAAYGHQCGVDSGPAPCGGDGFDDKCCAAAIASAGRSCTDYGPPCMESQ